MLPPTHQYFGPANNGLRLQQGKCLLDIIKTKKDMSTLHMKKIWEHDDHNSFLKESNRFTTTGLSKYWLSVDSAIRYWNTAIAPKIGKTPRRQTTSLQHSKFHWKSHETYPKKNWYNRVFNKKWNYYYTNLAFDTNSYISVFNPLYLFFIPYVYVFSSMLFTFITIIFDPYAFLPVIVQCRSRLLHFGVISHSNM